MTELDSATLLKELAAGGRGEPQPAPSEGRPGVDAARVRAVVAGPRLRRAGGRAVGVSPVAALADRSDGVGGQPPHRGQPAELPPGDRPGLRARQRVGDLGQPVDRGGGAAGTPSASATTCSSLAVSTPTSSSVRGWTRWRSATTRARRTCSTSAPTSRSRSWRPGCLTATPAATRKEPIAEKLLTRVAKDENLHMIFYRNLVTFGAGADSEPDHACDH